MLLIFKTNHKKSIMNFFLNNFQTFLVFITILILSGCGFKTNKTEEVELRTESETSKETIPTTNHSLLFKYEVKQVDKANGTSQVEWTIKNIGDEKLTAKGWTLYFNQIAATIDEASLPNTVSIKNVTGDFHKLQPTENLI